MSATSDAFHALRRRGAFLSGDAMAQFLAWEKERLEGRLHRISHHGDAFPLEQLRLGVAVGTPFGRAEASIP